MGRGMLALPVSVGSVPEFHAEDEAAVGRQQPKACERRRMYRDLALALRCGLRNASAGFSFLLVRGLRASSAADADADARLFRQSQSLRHLQVVPVLFEHSLRRASADAVVTVAHALGIEPSKLRNLATDSEAALSLRVLPPLPRLRRRRAPVQCRQGTSEYTVDSGLEQIACLDTLLALMVDCSENVMDFEEQEGLSKIAELVKDTHKDNHIHSKFLSFSG